MFEKSNEIKNIAKALSIFHGKVGVIVKDVKAYNYKYADLPTVLSMIKEPLAEAGLAFSQFPSDINELVTILIHIESGEYFLSSYVITPEKITPQGFGSVITYQRRYALGAILGLNIDIDDDAATSEKLQTNPKVQQNANIVQQAMKAPAIRKEITDLLQKIIALKTDNDLNSFFEQIHLFTYINGEKQTVWDSLLNQAKAIGCYYDTDLKGFLKTKVKQ